MAASGSPQFQPRQTFDVSTDITRSYFLGHHHAALDRMRRMLSNVGLIIECRDFRIPLTSWNPHLERGLALDPTQRSRIIVYTKRDLGPPLSYRSSSRGSGSGSSSGLAMRQSGSEIANALTRFHQERGQAAEVIFLGQAQHLDRRGHHQRSGGGGGDRQLLEAVKRVARNADSLAGLRALVVGMPNAGKSTLLNRLRTRGMGPGFAKAARTGAQPGVTRKMGTPVRIVPGEGRQQQQKQSDDGTAAAASDGEEGVGEGVFVVDTPGVFVPYVSDAESMLKLALVGCVKDGLVPTVTVADYLLFHLNLRDPGLYSRFCGPTNDVAEFLEGVARRTGKLLRGGVPGIEGAADWIVQEWRTGRLGTFVLDEVTSETLEAAAVSGQTPTLSMNQARKKDKEMRRARGEAKRRGLAAES